MHAPNSEETNRRAIRLFLVLLVILATAAYAPILHAGSLRALGGLALALIMWAPGVSAILVSIVCFRSLAPCGFSIHRKAWPWLVVAWVIPALYTAAVYLPLDILGIVTLGGPRLTGEFLIVGGGQSLLFATGEEIGWRGFFTPLMARRFGFLPGSVAVGVIWAIYHVPAMLFAGYARSPHPLFGMTAFTATVVLLSVFLGALREESASLWPAAVFHASHNSLFLHFFDPVQPTSPAAVWLIGEQGVLLTLVMLVLASIGMLIYSRQAGREALPGAADTNGPN